MNNHSVDNVYRKVKWEQKPRQPRYPTKRWGHTSILKNRKLYIYGGKTGKVKDPVYQIDCDTLESVILESQTYPETRESHSCSLLKDKLIVWGGYRQE